MKKWLVDLYWLIVVFFIALPIIGTVNFFKRTFNKKERELYRQRKTRNKK